MAAKTAQDMLKKVFLEARTHHGFLSKPVPKDLLKEAYNLYRWAPTAFNCSPGRVLFVQSPEAKAKLDKCLMEGNRKQTSEAPVTAILAYDEKFHTKFNKLSPNYDAASVFQKSPELIKPTATLNGTLQCGYFILGCRAVGLDCGPMSGFNNAAVDEAFFKGTPYKSLILVNVGYGDASKLYPRAPRLEFEEATQIE